MPSYTLYCFPTEAAAKVAFSQVETLGKKLPSLLQIQDPWGVAYYLKVTTLQEAQQFSGHPLQEIHFSGREDSEATAFLRSLLRAPRSF